MPHRTEHREIIPARVGRAVLSAEHSRLAQATYSRCQHRNDSWRYMALLEKTWGNTSHKLPGPDSYLFLSAIQRSTSRFASSLRLQKVPACRYMPQNAPVGRQSDTGPCPTCRTTLLSFQAPHWRSEGNACPDRPYIGVPYLGTTFGDFEDEGLQRCRPRTKPGSTCDLPSSRRLCASPPELCVGGAKVERARTLSGRDESSDTAAATLTPGVARPTNQTALENADTASLPCRGERRVGSTLRRGDATPRSSASDTVRPRSREVPVTPRLALRQALWTTTLAASTQINVPAVVR